MLSFFLQPDTSDSAGVRQIKLASLALNAGTESFRLRIPLRARLSPLRSRSMRAQRVFACACRFARTICALREFIDPEAEDFINEEEIAKYSPSLEITQAEEALLSREIIDVADIIEKILQDKKDV